MRSLKISSIAIVFLGLMSLNAHAQKDKELEGSLDVVRGYKPSFYDPAKINIPVIKEKVKVGKIDFDYAIEPKSFMVKPYHRLPLEAITLGESKLDPLQRSYSILGLGNLSTTFADIYIGSLRSKKNLYAVRLNHFAGNGPYEVSGFSEQKLQLYGKRQLKNKVLDAQLSLGRTKVDQYGFNQDTISLAEDQLDQTYYLVDANVGFGNLKNRGSKHRYDLDVDFYYMQDDTTSSEWSFQFRGKHIEKLKENSSVHIGAELDINRYTFQKNELSFEYDRSFIRLAPSYHVKKDRLEAKLGVKTVTATDSAESEFNLYADIDVSYKLVGDYLIAFAGITGDLDKHSYRSLSADNPFISNLVNLRTTDNKLVLYAGVKGSFSDYIDYRGSFEYSTVQNLMFYLNSSFIGNTFTPIYDDKTATLTHLNGEVSYKELNKWRLGGAFNLYSFDLSGEAKPWNLPTLDVSFSGQYIYREKIITNLEVFMFNERFGTDVNRVNVEKMDGGVDASLDVTYVFSKRFSFFVNLHNLLNQEYQLFNRYPVRGFNVLAGAKISL